MNATTIETVSSQALQCPRKRPALRRFRRLAFLAAVGMGLAAAGMAQVPSEPIAAQAPVDPTLPPIASSIPQCPSQVIPGGVKDNFVTTNGIEASAPSATLQAAVGPPFADFDGTTQNVHFAHTFRLPPCKCLVGAKLELVAKALGTSNQFSSGNDAVTLGFSTLSGFPRWGAYLGGATAPPALSTPAWGSPPLQRTFTLDLANLTGGTSLLSAMQTNGYLDFYVQDDTSIDYVNLTVTMCDCCKQHGKTEMCITKFFDKNRNGVQDSSELGLSGWKFKATDQAGGNVVISPPTNSAGKTCFTVLAPATYTISELTQSGWTQTTTNPVVPVNPGGPVVNLLFGNWSGRNPEGPINPQ